MTVLQKNRNGLRKSPVFRKRVLSELAREIATAKPAFIAQGWGPQRSNGRCSRAIAMLQF